MKINILTITSFVLNLIMLLSAANGIKIIEKDVKAGVKIIIPGVRISDLIVSEVLTNDGFKTISILRRSKKNNGVPHPIPDNNVKLPTGLNQEILKDLKDKTPYQFKDPNDKNNTKGKESKEIKPKKPVVIKSPKTNEEDSDSSNVSHFKHVEFPNGYKDPSPGNISINMLNEPGNCFYIKNMKTGLYITYEDSVHNNLILRPFYKKPNQVLCTFTANKKEKKSDMYYCFKIAPNVCLDGNEEEPGATKENPNGKSFIINYVNKSSLKEYNSTFKFVKDYKGEAIDVLPFVHLIELKTYTLNTAPLTVFNGVVKAIYNPEFKDSSADLPKDPFMRWGFYLVTCKTCVK